MKKNKTNLKPIPVGLETYLSQSPFFRDLVEDLGIERVKKDFKERLASENTSQQRARTLPGPSLELQGAIDNMLDYAYQQAFEVKDFLGSLVAFPLFLPQVGYSGSEETPITLAGTPPGIEVEIWWPRLDDRKGVELAIKLFDWDAFGLDPSAPVGVGLRVVRRPRAKIPWQPWINEGFWCGTIQPGQRDVEASVTSPGPVAGRQRSSLRRWIESGGLALLPPWQPACETG